MPRLPLRLEKDIETELAETLERIWRGARLERAAAEHRRTSGLYALGDLNHLLYGLDAARSRNDLERSAAHLHARAVHNGVVRLELAVRRLVRLLDALY